MDNQNVLLKELEKLLRGGGAHATFDDAIANLDPALRGQKADDLPYTIWQLVEHIRIAQWDMLEFSKNANHKSPKWPDEYWVKELAPADYTAWEASIKQIDDDMAAFMKLLKSEDIYKPIPHGDGQNILREALQIADHNAYHIAEIVVIRRVLGAWG